MGDPAWSIVFAAREFLAPHGAKGSSVAPLKNPSKSFLNPVNTWICWLKFCFLFIYHYLLSYEPFELS